MTTTWQATRSLTSEDGRPVEVSLGFPESDGDSWRCDVRIVVDGTTTVTPWKGHDAFAALQMAFMAIWHEVDRLGCREGEDLPPKSHGFNRPVPIDPMIYDVDAFNAMLEARMENLDATPAGVAAAKALGRAVARKWPPPSPGGG